ncbi:2,3-epoxybenzoyl-CoA dihydrolase [Phenylobacterium montanum]|uniref:Benzoyl-CoA-dihydrodiol lyase n=1 Tax=Phenylobacterium montanum TaxID=2823693 RepID=A0A975IWD4_9CAUL|nr:2,3-epoxybenzoyl-CoA dihydrolase [Caulobacter sp. S6]QUD89474.1 benzoyl-CoA-dihydrodiol lyase [Caulobacter sp. S6]
MITFDRTPTAYRHWRLAVDGRIATLTLDVDEEGGLVPGYRLKLNSYDLGVDIELYDALQRIRFEHPQVGCVVITSGKDRMFCAGANIYMLGHSSHGWKVNFCKFTNETRNGLEDSSRHDGLKFVAALNGTTAGGGYEVALACDEIVLIDDRSSVVSLPEVPLLGVLPGTGGLTRVVDKRKVRRDLADLFCTSADGVKGAKALAWGLVDHIAAPNAFPAKVRERAEALVAKSSRPESADGIALTPLERCIDETGYHYRHVDARFDRAGRTVHLTLKAPETVESLSLDQITARGADWWPLALARELDDAILMLRANEPELGLWVIRSEGDPAAVLAADRGLIEHQDHWLARETVGLLRRTLHRLDATSRSLYAVIDRASCFAGLLFEVALAADRSYMLTLPEDDPEAVSIALDGLNFGLLPDLTGQSRLAARFSGDEVRLGELRQLSGRSLGADQAFEHGLVTVAPDDLDWDEEIRIAIEERAALSPDALTGLEASLRFAGRESLATKIFGRLSAWQNWVFNRPNATGEAGALKLFGSGSKPQFNWERV